MEKYIFKFSGCAQAMYLTTFPVVILTLDENGKHVSFEDEHGNKIETIERIEGKSTILELPKRVLKAFTASAIERIFEVDEFPKDEYMILDGFSYIVEITKGNVTKEYRANDSNIEHYNLLKYLASWYRRL